jgi:hypothetical protein
MPYTITPQSNYLRAELFNRQNAQETREFLEQVKQEGDRHRMYRVLITVVRSKPIFTVEDYGLTESLEAAKERRAKVAITSDSREVHLSQQYVETLARMKGVNLRAFTSEGEALKWLQAESMAKL